MSSSDTLDYLVSEDDPDKKAELIAELATEALALPLAELHTEISDQRDWIGRQQKALSILESALENRQSA